MFLNAYWEYEGGGDGDLATPPPPMFRDNPEERERVWNWSMAMGKINKRKGEGGCSPDEWEAHVFLDRHMDALTVQCRESGGGSSSPFRPFT